jgi:uncharacterized protein YqjF (DUF2071 family)
MTQLERPFLTARWTELLLVNFPVPTGAVADLAPPGTEPDLFEGQAYVSIVGFQFRDTRVRGCAWPGHTHFPEINLRYYVRRIVDGEVRRGVVFVQEIVPRRLIAAVANRLFHENYVCRPMRSELHMSRTTLAEGDRVSYAWQSSRLRLSGHPQPTALWNTLAARVAAPFRLPPANSFDEFIVEHYWGYAHGRDGATREYRVAHDPWRVALADDVTWDCDVAATYHTPLAKYLMSPPTSALIADGAAVQVFPGHTI